MSDEIKTQGDVVRAARKGMRLKAIAARAGMSLSKLQVLLAADERFALAVETAYADFEEEQREEIEHARREAIANGDTSLRYKIAREAVKELNERDAVTRPMQVVVSQDSGLIEPEYESYSEEELAAIRAKTESEANGE